MGGQETKILARLISAIGEKTFGPFTLDFVKRRVSVLSSVDGSVLTMSYDGKNGTKSAIAVTLRYTYLDGFRKSLYLKKWNMFSFNEIIGYRDVSHHASYTKSENNVRYFAVLVDKSRHPKAGKLIRGYCMCISHCIL